jgi:actin related protein 2/3 complex subunit 5
LSAVLNNPPLNTKNQQLKETTFSLVMRVLKSFQNTNEIENAVKALNQEGIDVLMKYIYKGFEREPRDSGVLLNWHEKVYAIGGNGCIVRVLSDGKRV